MCESKGSKNTGLGCIRKRLRRVFQGRNNRAGFRLGGNAARGILAALLMGQVRKVCRGVREGGRKGVSVGGSGEVRKMRRRGKRKKD